MPYSKEINTFLTLLLILNIPEPLCLDQLGSAWIILDQLGVYFTLFFNGVFSPILASLSPKSFGHISVYNLQFRRNSWLQKIIIVLCFLYVLWYEIRDERITIFLVWFVKIMFPFFHPMRELPVIPCLIISSWLDMIPLSLRQTSLKTLQSTSDLFWNFILIILW